MALFKSSGQMKAYWGQYASASMASPKNDAKVSKSSLDKWHSICNSHSATVLSAGVVKFDDVKNPDFEVKVEYWKASKSKKPRPESMTLRDVLHGLKVPGQEKDVQVIQGFCPAPDGGYKVSFPETVPAAKTLALNIASHPAGWILGYLTEKGWKKECIHRLLKKSFTTSSIMSAQESTWDKKSGRVTSDAIDAEELELRELENSWVNMDLGVMKKEAEVKHAELKAGDIAAFDFEEGASCKTMTSEVGSDAETSYLDSDDEESEEEGSSEESDSSGEDGSNTDDSEDDGSSPGVQFEELKKKIIASDSEEEAAEEVYDEPETTQENHPLEWLIRGSFEEDLGLQEVLLALAHAEKFPQQAWDIHASLMKNGQNIRTAYISV